MERAASAIARDVVPNLNESRLFNRELSWLEFNRRVLEEALDSAQPLLERLKFLAIFSTNLDEFFMIRVAGLQEQAMVNPMKLSPDDLTPASQLRMITERLLPMLDLQMKCLLTEIMPQLEQYSVRIVPYAELSEVQQVKLKTFFYERIFPVLTPLSVDPSHPFPYISNISLNLGTLVAAEPLHVEAEPRFARIKLPPNVPRLVPIGIKHHFILLEELVAAHIDLLFPGMRVLECQPFRITRNADIEIEEDEADDLMESIEQQLRKRRFGFCVRLEVASGMSPHMVQMLRNSFEIGESQVYTVFGPLNIPDLMALYKLDLPQLKDKPFTPATPHELDSGETIFEAIRHQDILLHHPYDSFTPVLEFLRAAAQDPNVLAIKQTLYRVGPDSPVVKALIEAAERGKQVAVLVELKARFDEGNNIVWARRLEQVGVHVVYGVLGLKTHAKLTLVVRKEASTLRRYMHLGTGNYNPVTARIYTDMGLLTCDPDIGADVSEVFNILTGYSRQKHFRKLLVSPINLRTRLIEMIRREIEYQRAGCVAGIMAKCNSLTDSKMIKTFYAASHAGVPIDLLVRGICCLRPGLPGRSETIRVGSIVGRFLEHSRVLRFLNGGCDEIYMGSADIMPRNLDRRVEVLFPIEDECLKARVRREIFDLAFADNVKMRRLQPDGSYFRPPQASDARVNSQAALLAAANHETSNHETHETYEK